MASSVVDLGDGTVVKYGPRVTVDEGHALRLAHDYITTASVPKIFDIITDNSTKETYIVQQKIVGRMISEILPNMDNAALLQVAFELRAFIRELSKLDGDGTRLGLVGDAGCFARGRWKRYDRRRFGGLRMEGIHTTERFIRWLDDYVPSCALSREQRDNWIGEFQFHRPTIFSHGDLQPENILIHEGHVSGVIDWECAGWYPYFWNDYIATLKWDPENPWQKVVVPAMLEYQYPREVFAFRHLEHYADSYGH